MNVLVRIILSAAMILLTGCTANHISKTSEQSSLSTKTAFRDSVYKITRRDCTACHAVTTERPQHASPDMSVAYNAAKPFANFTDVPASTLVQRVKDGHCGVKCQTNGAEMIAAIEAWASREMSQYTGDSPTQEAEAIKSIGAQIVVDNRSHGVSAP